MVDIASLAIQIDTSDVGKAERDLERFGASGAKTERAAKSIETALTSAASAAGVYQDANGRLRESNGQFVSDARKVELGLKGIGTEAKGASRALDAGAGSAGGYAKRVASLTAEMARASTSIASTFRALDGLGSIGGIDSQIDKFNGSIKESKGRADEASDAFERFRDRAEEVRDVTPPAGSAVDSLGDAFRRLAIQATAFISVTAAISKVSDVQRQFDVLNAGLVTATGSAKNAQVAFSALQDFARQTPYDLAQAVEGFTKLVNLGLTPSEKALRSYGNTASALGKDLNQMIEAVADASTGEFERLKEFGIKAKQNGDQVSLTFQGVTKSIGNNAAEIEKYLTDLGENQFAGAMTQRMATLDGAISNLGDSWDAFARNISNAGAGDLMEGAVRQAIDALDELNAQLESGQLEAQLGAISGKFDGWGGDIAQTLDIVGDIFESATGRWGALVDNNVENMTSTFANFPENVRAFIQLMTVEVLNGFDKVTAYSAAFKDGIKAIFTDDTMEGVGARLEADLQRLNELRDDSIASILEERDAALTSYSDQMSAAQDLRKVYDDAMERSAQATADRLAKFKALGSSAGAAGDAVEKLGKKLKNLDATGPGDAINDYIKQFEKLHDELNPAEVAAREYGKQQELLNDIIARGGENADKARGDLAKLREQYEENNQATSEWARWTEGALDRVDAAFADAWRNIGDGFSSFRDSLTNAFKQMLAELAHMAITKPIVIQIGAALGIGGAAGQATAMMGGGSGGGIGVGSLLQYGQTAYSAITGVGPAALAGYQSGGIMGGIQGVGGYYGGALSGINAGAGQVVGTLLNGGGMTYAPLSYQLSSGALNGAIGGLAGIGGALYGYNQAGLKGAATGGLGGWGGATLGNILLPGIGGIIGGALGSALGGSLFGGDWETKDVGLAFSVENGDFLGQQYEYQKKKGGLFSSNKKRTRFSALDDETAARFQSVYDATEDTVAGLFESLSYSVEEASLAGLQLARTKISTKGKTEEQIQEAIAEWFGSAANAMTAELNKVFNTGLDLDLEGMQAFVGNLTGVNEVLRYLDVEMYDASVAGGKLAESLSSVAGGLDALAANSQTYYGAFFTDAEKVEDTIDSITRAFESADVELVGSREAYRAMVEDIDLTTEAGQKMFATMMALSGQAAQYYSIIEQKAAQANALLIGSVNTAYAALQRSIANQQRELQAAYSARVGSLNDMAATASANLSGMTSVASSLDAALKRLRGTSDDAVRMLRAQAVMTLNSALVTARAGGSLAGFEGLQDALDVASEMDASLYGSLEDFEREQGRTANLVAELEKVNGKQLTTEEKLLRSVQDQLKTAQQQYEADMAGLDAQLAYAQAQLDALNGIDNSIMGVAAAIAAMNASVVAALQAMPKDAAKSNTPQNNRSIIDTIYQSVLGRGTEGDEAGAAFWANALQSGTATYQDIAASIAKGALGNSAESAATKKSAEEYLKGLGIPGFASGGLFGGGLRIVGEKGPELEVTGPSRIYSASQTAAMLGGAGSTEELRALRGEVAGLRSALGAIAKYTESTAYGVRQMNEIGLPQPEAA